MTRLLRMLAVLALLAPLAPEAFGEDVPSVADVVRAFEEGDDALVLENVALALDSKRTSKRDADRLRYLAGEAHLRLGNFDDAAEAFHAVVESRPKAVPAWIGLGRAELGRDKADAARKALDRALSLERKSPDVRLALGELLLRTGELDKALPHLEAASAKMPKDPRIVRALVELHLRAESTPKAKRAVMAFERKAPGQPMGPFLRGLVLEREGESDAAIKAYEAAVALDDTFIDAHKNLAILCHTDNPTYTDIPRTRKALRHYERYFALGGKDAQLKRYYETTKGFVEKLLAVDPSGDAYFREPADSPEKIGLQFVEGIVTADIDQLDRCIAWAEFHAWARTQDDAVAESKDAFRTKVLGDYRKKLKPMGPKPLLHPMLRKMQSGIKKAEGDGGLIRLEMPETVRGVNIVVKQVGDEWRVVQIS